MSTARYFTLDELSARLGVPARRLGEILADDVRRGLVAQDGDGFRLSAEAERLHGDALRDVHGERS